MQLLRLAYVSIFSLIKQWVSYNFFVAIDQKLNIAKCFHLLTSALYFCLHAVNGPFSKFAKGLECFAKVKSQPININCFFFFFFFAGYVGK